jgi:hypothetical protein
MKLKYLVLGSAFLALAGCNTIQQYSFQPNSGQMVINRDGLQGVVSKRAKSVVVVSNARRGPAAGYRRVVVGIQNVSNTPINFNLSDAEIFETKNGEPTRSMTVVTYERLVNEEKTRQVIGALLLGAAAGANAYAASQAGYGTAYGTVNTTSYGRYGTYNSTSNVAVNYYDPGVNYMAQANAAAQNAQMMANASANAERNLSVLENGVIKSNTMMPGEWYGGQLFFEVPTAMGEIADLKTFLIRIRVGADVHQFNVSTGP